MTIVNLRSDTQTRPTEEMRRVMAAAEVGDEQYFLDPTVTELCERVAGLLGHEAAVFLPSGTMCNHIGLRLHIRPGGDEIILHRSAHPIMAESGSPAALTGAMVNPLDSDDGTFTAEQVRGALRQVGNRYQPVSRLVHVEQTTNLMGGRVWRFEQLEAVLGVAAEHGLRTHLDGARLMNAVVASGVSARDWASLFDTAWIDFTKGLGAPLGACLAGSTELIEEAWRWKQMMGGSMRQAGIVAAGGAVRAGPQRRAPRGRPRARPDAGRPARGDPRRAARPGAGGDEHRRLRRGRRVRGVRGAQRPTTCGSARSTRPRCARSRTSTSIRPVSSAPCAPWRTPWASCAPAAGRRAAGPRRGPG